MGVILYWTRKYDQAIEQYHKTLELDPNFAQAYDGLADVYAKKGMYKEAIVEEQKYLTLLGDEEGAATLSQDFELYGYKKAKHNQFETALEMTKEAANEQYISPITFAILYAKLEQKDESFTWLEKAFAERSPWLTYMSADPDFDSLRSDARFKDLVRRIGLPWIHI